MSTSLFGDHIKRLSASYDNALARKQKAGSNIDAILLHSGTEQMYFGDDRHIKFQAFGHFSHWLPVPRPDQFVLYRTGHKPVYLQVVPDDYWYEQTVDLNAGWVEQFEVVRLKQVAAVAAQLQGLKCAYLGENTSLANSWGIATGQCNPASLLAYLDFHRAVKSPYELEQLRAASKLALQGHAAARQCFLQGGSEYEIHMAFLTACNILEEESPYTNIVALDEKSAILHYQNKRRGTGSGTGSGSGKHSQVLLIDAGCRVNGYCSDITRTSVKTTTHPVFQSLVRGMDTLQQSLVKAVRPGLPYPKLQALALRGVVDLLVEHGICHGAGADLFEQGIGQWFMPHGVGHLLGIQVHDVGGHQVDENGAKLPPPANSPSLRNTRIMAEDMVFTVEPGLYFIPMILEAKRQSDQAALVNWHLVKELYSCGGIRIEDNVRIAGVGAENLTRQFEQQR
ncbi:MAG: Xaa-Pro dipeptidase [Gammaproteobacteria bacterium]|nr:Xaa-Pro dipeptidase [Gammaproteobacteria bacterium]